MLYAKSIAAPLLAELTKDTNSPLFPDLIKAAPQKEKSKSDIWSAGVSSFSQDGKESTIIVRTRPWIVLEFADPLNASELLNICEESLDSDYDWEKWYTEFAKELRAICKESLKGEKTNLRFQVNARVFPDKHCDLSIVSGQSPTPPLSVGFVATPFPKGIGPKSVRAEFLIELDGASGEFPSASTFGDAPRFCVRYEIQGQKLSDRSALRRSEQKRESEAIEANLKSAVLLQNQLFDCSEAGRSKIVREIKKLYKNVFTRGDQRSTLQYLETNLNERAYLIGKKLMRFEDESPVSESDLRRISEVIREYEFHYGEACRDGNPKALYQLGRLVYRKDPAAGKVINDIAAAKGYFRAKALHLDVDCPVRIDGATFVEDDASSD